MMIKEKKYLLVVICILAIIGLLAVRYNIDPSFGSIIKDLVPNFVSSLIVLPIIFLLFDIWGIKIDDSEEASIVGKIRDSVTEVIQADRDVVVYRNQHEANNAFLERIDLKKKKASLVEVVQYSSDYVLPVIKALIEAGRTINLYIQNPTSAFDPYQEKKINGRLAEYTVNTLYKKAFDEKRLHIYLYKHRLSIRAIKSDDLLLIGSYIYTNEVHGDDNFAVMFTDLSDIRAESAMETFKLQLEYLKNNSTEWYPVDHQPANSKRSTPRQQKGT